MDTSIPTADEINDMSDAEYKVLENRLRRAAQRQGLVLQKSRARDPRATNYGTFGLYEMGEEGTLWSRYGDESGYGLSLRGVAKCLWGKRD
jgi:hypothetical protein